MASNTSLPTVPQVPLGKHGLLVSKQGLGCMGFSPNVYSKTAKPEAESIKVLQEAIDLGVTFLDTMDLYGPFTNEILVGKAIEGRREKVQISDKYGPVTEGGKIVGHSMTAEHTRACVMGALERLQVDYIELYTLRSTDPHSEVEEPFRELKKLVDEGKIKYVGCSEFDADEIRRANAVCPLTAVQLEWSLWTRDVEENIIPTCRELGIGIVAYSPQGKGFFTGTITSLEDLADGDRRRHLPRFQMIEKNRRFYQNMKALADKKGCTPGQLALAWVHHQGVDVIPLPGSTNIEHVKENIGALTIKLSEQEMTELAEAVPHAEVEGIRSFDMRMTYHKRAF